MDLQNWVSLPSWWINEKRLRELRWGTDGKGSDNSAALIALAVITHHASGGTAKLTYSQLCKATGMSRSKLSNGLDVLEKMGIVDRAVHGRSTYGLRNFDLGKSKADAKFRWAALPAKRLYSAGRAFAFSEFKLRSETELNALKLYFLFAARRGVDVNMAIISYDKIEEYTAIERHHIKAAISLLAALNLVYVEQVPTSMSNDHRIANAYRLARLIHPTDAHC